RNDPSSLLRAAAGAATMFFCYFALAFAYPKGMGFGDVKLAGVIGAVLGFLSYPALIVGAFAAFVIGGFAGALAIVSGRGSGKTALPFGPFMIGGALLALFASAVLSTGYTRLVFRA
ncbi:MAG: pilD, partial [Pseudonocardiales bacterium]|nr:pilD [Pseudonocardiales bacterium]